MSNCDANKPQAFFLGTHVMVIADADTPAPHSHLATQLTISLGQTARWEIGDCVVSAPAVYIDGGIEHHCLSAGDYLTFLFVKTGGYAYDAQQHLLRNKPFTTFDENICLFARECVRQYARDPQRLSDEVLEACGLSATTDPPYDERIHSALQTLEKMDTIPECTPKLLSDEASLSQSRFSHLFKQETGMPLASYLAFLKLRKTYQALRSGKSITQAAMDTGFSSPSHCASTCTKMFGVSLSNISVQ